MHVIRGAVDGVPRSTVCPPATPAVFRRSKLGIRGLGTRGPAGGGVTNEDDRLSRNNDIKKPKRIHLLGNKSAPAYISPENLLAHWNHDMQVTNLPGALLCGERAGGQAEAAAALVENA